MVKVKNTKLEFEDNKKETSLQKRIKYFEELVKKTSNKVEKKK